MLAGTIKDGVKIPFPVMASPKLDGIRALVRGTELVSRKLKLIPNINIQQALGNANFHGYDGELVVGIPRGQDVYTRTMSGIMSEGGAPEVTFWVFDYWDGKAEYHRRHLRLPTRLHVADNVVIRRLPNSLIHNEDQLTEYETRLLSQGYEGVMLRRLDAPYKFGRSTPREFFLMKLKRFEDSEAIILGLVEQNRNDNEATINNLGRTKRSSHKANKVPKGTTGALQVRDLKTGVEFEIGTGLDDATRAAFWAEPPIGRTITYKFQPTGVKDKPRFPVYKGFRND